MSQETFDSLMAAAEIAMRIAAARVLSICALVMTFGLACWAMWMQSVMAAVISGGFAVLVFLPVLIGERKKETSSG